MIGLPLNSAEALGLPTGTSISMPPVATPDFAALFNSVAVVSSNDSPLSADVAIPSKDAPLALRLPPQTYPEMPTAPTPPGSFSVTPPTGEAPDMPKASPVAVGIEEAAIPTQLEPIASVKPSDAGETPVATTEPLFVVRLMALPVGVPGDPPLDENASAGIAPDVDRPMLVRQTVADSAPQPRALSPDAAPVGIAAPVVVEPAKRASGIAIERTELSFLPPSEVRALAPGALSDKPFVPALDRSVTFAPVIADAVRDLIAIAQEKDVRFNVRPEMLGPIAVTIERTDAGPTLRLGVETLAAAQVVRQAEPTLNDARGAAPFLQITVDMNAPDSRGRSARATPPQRAIENNVVEQIHHQVPVSTGRYA